MGPQFQRLEIDRYILGSAFLSSLSEVHAKWGESQKFFMMQIRGKILHALNPISMETSEQRKNKIGGRHCVTFFPTFIKKTSNEARNSSLN